MNFEKRGNMIFTGLPPNSRIMVACAEIDEDDEKVFREKYTIHCIYDQLRFFDIFETEVSIQEVTKCDIISEPYIGKLRPREECNDGQLVYGVGYNVSKYVFCVLF